MATTKNITVATVKATSATKVLLLEAIGASDSRIGSAGTLAGCERCFPDASPQYRLCSPHSVAGDEIPTEGAVRNATCRAQVKSLKQDRASILRK